MRRQSDTPPVFAIPLPPGCAVVFVKTTGALIPSHTIEGTPEALTPLVGRIVVALGARHA